MTKHWITMAGLAALALASGVSAAPGPLKLDIEHFAFEPSTVTVARGTTVTWVNHDEETHTVTSRSGAFTSPALEVDQAFSHTFAQPGTYSYFCALHPHMRATIVVKGDD
jgi:plastocyanin